MRFSRCSLSCPVMFIYSDRVCMKWPVIYLAGKPGQRGISVFHATSHKANLVSFFAEIINVANEGYGADAFSLDFGRHLYYLPSDILITRVTLHIVKNVHVQ